MPSFEQDHQYLLELSNIFEPTSQYALDYTFSSIDNEITDHKLWAEDIDGPFPSEVIKYTPENWYTQYWYNCEINNYCVDFDG